MLWCDEERSIGITNIPSEPPVMRKQYNREQGIVQYALQASRQF
jgi:hypothetical protein